ncbi:MAG: tRNA (adenosine(37)-N6)-threonylcarbamoyltransferase complex dimerization subunit type 1 TsaB [Gammaproteobacteria bacterium]
MKILALETSSERCSAALLVDAEVIERAQLAQRAHAELLLPMVESLLAEAGVTLTALGAVAFGRGPGGFTGLRVATSVAQGLAFGADLPVVPVSDLAVVAEGAHRLHGAQTILACLDARMQEVYWCGFNASGPGRMEALGNEQLGPAAMVTPPAPGPWFGAGSAFGIYARVLSTRLGASLMGTDAGLLPMARDVATLAAGLLAVGRVVRADDALPVYLRDRVAEPKPAV